MPDIYCPTTPSITKDTRVNPDKPHEHLFGDAEMSDDTEEAAMSESKPDHTPNKEIATNE